MRTPLIAGNWKQHKTEAEAIALVRWIMRGVRQLQHVEVLVCPPYTALSQLHKLLVSSPVLLGAQNLSEHTGGAYTGAISPAMVAEFCSHVIVGHSERRALYGETDQRVHRKIRAALGADLIPILCVGESLEDRELGRASQTITGQLRTALQNVFITSGSELVIAYEPVWAIGTGRSAAPEDAQQIAGGVIRPGLEALLGKEPARACRVLYGGSVNAGNAAAFLDQEDIDGALVGGASLTAESFLGLIEQIS